MDGKVVVVNHTGAINWASPAIFLSHCRISVTHFPFDKQKCELKFGPWQHDGTELILHGKGEILVEETSMIGKRERERRKDDPLGQGLFF